MKLTLIVIIFLGSLILREHAPVQTIPGNKSIEFNHSNSIVLSECSLFSDNYDDELIPGRRKGSLIRTLSNSYDADILNNALTALKNNTWFYNQFGHSFPDKYIFQRVLRV